jgi:hypothetical protein
MNVTCYLATTCLAIQIENKLGGWVDGWVASMKQIHPAQIFSSMCFPIFPFLFNSFSIVQLFVVDLAMKGPVSSNPIVG